VPGVKVSGVYGSPAVGRVGACVGRCGSWPPSGVIAKTLTSDSLLPNLHYYYHCALYLTRIAALFQDPSQHPDTLLHL
jgi:hypothetical protein